MIRQNASKRQFVIIPRITITDKERELLSDLGIIEPMSGTEILTISVKYTSDDAESAWLRLQKSVEGIGDAVPVLVDNDGHQHFPTGEITVRFSKPVDEKTLRQFEKRHSLALKKRNEFVGQQIVFDVPKRGTRYLPDLVGTLSDDVLVQKAWLNTISQYKRQ